MTTLIPMSLMTLALLGCGPQRTASAELASFRGGVSGRATLSQPTDADPVVVSIQLVNAGEETRNVAIYRGASCPRSLYEKRHDLTPATPTSSVTELRVALSSLLDSNAFAVVVMAPGAVSIDPDGTGIAACGNIR